MRGRKAVSGRAALTAVAASSAPGRRCRLFWPDEPLRGGHPRGRVICVPARLAPAARPERPGRATTQPAGRGGVVEPEGADRVISSAELNDSLVAVGRYSGTVKAFVMPPSSGSAAVTMKPLPPACRSAPIGQCQCVVSGHA